MPPVPGVKRLFRLPWRTPADVRGDVDDELAFHLEARARDLVAGGAAEDAARAQARREFGDVDAARHALHADGLAHERAARRREGLDALARDLRVGLRGLRRAPGFALAVVATLALGIGAVTAVFSVVYGVLLRPLPYPAADRLVTVHTRYAAYGIDRGNFSTPEFTDLSSVRALESVALLRGADLTVTGAGDPERVRGQRATASLFRVLRTPALVGRVFTPAEDGPGQPPVVVLGHGYWQRRHGGDPRVVGRTVTADGVPRTVVGVMPATFTFRGADVYVPMALDLTRPDGRGDHDADVLGRLAPGATEGVLDAQLGAVATRLRRDYPTEYTPDMGFSLDAVPWHEGMVGGARPALRVLAGAVAVVLLIACANAANLLLARGEVRRRELAVRAALGAGRGRVARQLLTESAVLAVAAGAVGLAAAAAGVRALLAVNPDALPLQNAVTLDGPVAAAALGLSLLTALLFGTLPALAASRIDLQGTLRAGGRGGTAPGDARLRRALVVGEVALAVVVVVAAGLLLRSFWALRRVDAGLDPAGVLTMTTSLPKGRYPDSRVEPAYAALLDGIRALPNVAAAGGVMMLPLGPGGGRWIVKVAGRPAAPGAPDPTLRPQILTPGALEAMRVPVVRGRGLRASDDARAPLVALVNQAAARTLWPGQDALGRQFRVEGDTTAYVTVVGVVRDTRSEGLGRAAVPEFYLPHAQTARRNGGEPWRDLTLVVRAGGTASASDPARLAGPIRDVVRALDPQLAVADVRAMRQVIDRSVAQPRFTMLLVSAFGGAALVLAALGVYGVIAYGVAQRAREFGVRVALGARRRDVLRLVVEQGVRLAGVGVALGVAGALAATRLLRALLFEVGAADPLTFVTIALVLLGVAVLASLVPARRATRASLMASLRGD